MIQLVAVSLPALIALMLARGACRLRRHPPADARRRRAGRRGGRDGRDRDDAAPRLAAAARSRAGERPDGDRRRDRGAAQPGSRGLHARRARERQRQPGPAEPAAARPAIPRLPRVAAAGRAARDVGVHRRRPAERTVRRHAELGPDPDGGGAVREPDAGVEPALRAEHAGRRAVAGDEDRLLRSGRRGPPAGRIVRPPAAGFRPRRPRRALGRVRGGAILRRGGLAAVLAVADGERVRRGHVPERRDDGGAVARRRRHEADRQRSGAAPAAGENRRAIFTYPDITDDRMFMAVARGERPLAAT